MNRFPAVTWLCLGLGLVQPAGMADETYWQHDPAEQGDWFDPANWTNGVPAAGLYGDNADIDNGGEAEITGGIAGVYRLRLGLAAGASGRLDVSGGEFEAARSITLGYAGTGALSQSGGAVTTRYLYLGSRKFSSGTYELGNGELLGTTSQYIGSYGTGLFRQTGGVYTSKGDLRLAWERGSRGTYELSGGELTSGRFQYVGYQGIGHFVQTGGANIGEDELVLGCCLGSEGTYELIAGELRTDGIAVGYGGRGHFSQVGGINNTMGWQVTLHLGRSIDSEGTYELSAGELLASDICVGERGTGQFIHTGGVNTVTGTLVLGEEAGSHGVYRLSDTGRLRAGPFIRVGGAGTGRFEWLGGSIDTWCLALSPSGTLAIGYDFRLSDLLRGALFEKGGTISGLGAAVLEVSNAAAGTQAGGSLTVRGLAVTNESKYELAGGTIEISDGLNLAGRLDCAGSAASIHVGDNALVNLGDGQVVNAGQAGLAVGANSLTIYAPGFHPSDLFGSFNTQGMMHQAGQTLVVPAGRGFGGWGEIHDHVDCAGMIVASGSGSIDLKEGLSASPGAMIDLGSGSVTVEGDRSNMSGGELYVRRMYVGRNGTGLLRQTGGINTVDRDLCVGHSPAASGTYELSGGEVRSKRNQYVGSDGTGLFRQTGGTNRIETALCIGRHDGAWGTYQLSGGELRCDGKQYIGEAGIGLFQQTAGTNAAADGPHLGRDVGSSGTYELNGGQLLSQASQIIGWDGTGLFQQACGANTIGKNLRLGYDPGSQGTYDLSGGRLQSEGSQIIGDHGTGLFRQSGGTNTLGGGVTLGIQKGSSGTYELSGGTLCSEQGQSVGHDGTGLFRQSGGTNMVGGDLSLATHSSSLGTYELSGGLLWTAGEQCVARYGTGRFLQTGGTNTVGGALYLGYHSGSEGTYELDGGKLSAHEEHIGREGAGLFRHRGGINSTGLLFVSSTGRYEFGGGSLLASGRVSLEGELDCYGSNARITASDNTMVDLTRARVLNSHQATLAVGANSLTIHAPGSHPSDLFGDFHTLGMIHQLGDTLLVPPGRGFGGWGEVPDHVDCAGTIAAAAGRGINIHDGLSVAPGASASLGSGILTVNDTVSGVSGSGQLSVGSEYIGGDPFSESPYLIYEGHGLFRQTGGTNTIGEDLCIGHNKGSTGTYQLSVGELHSGRDQCIGRCGYGQFVHTGGTNTIDGNLYFGYGYGSSGTYELSGGQLRSGHDQYVGYNNSSTGQFALEGGANLVDGDLFIGYRGVGSFVQAGGANSVTGAVHLGHRAGSVGTYAIWRGSLTSGDLHVGEGGSGGLDILGPAVEITVSDLFRLGRNSTLAAVPGATVRMTGPHCSFENESTDPTALAGLSGLSLLLASDENEVRAAMEVGGEDKGAVIEAWSGNFALGTLTLGSRGAGKAQLMDSFDNQPTWVGNEALYVGTLVLNPGAVIDLNGLNLYFLNGGAPKQFFLGDANLDGDVDGGDYVTWADHYKALLPGDASGDGEVTGLDYTIWADHYGQSGGWGEGDFNGDGVVNGGDYTSWADNYGGPAWKHGDFNGDGVVDGGDYTSWADNYGAGSLGQSVPEPGAVLLLALGGMAVMGRRERHRPARRRAGHG